MGDAPYSGAVESSVTRRWCLCRRTRSEDVARGISAGQPLLAAKRAGTLGGAYDPRIPLYSALPLGLAKSLFKVQGLEVKNFLISLWIKESASSACAVVSPWPSQRLCDKT